MSGRRAAVAIRSLVNTKGLQFECARVLHETLLVPVLMYDSERMVRKEKERSRVRSVQMDNLRCLLSIRRMDKVLNARIRQLCGVTNGEGKENLWYSVLVWPHGENRK